MNFQAFEKHEEHTEVASDDKSNEGCESKSQGERVASAAAPLKIQPEPVYQGLEAA
jgi:hypothetical protein